MTDEDQLVQNVVSLAAQYGRYGYRRITALLRREGWRVNHKRVERIWRQEGLKVPKRQPRRGRLWLHDGSCVRRRAEHRNHVWSYDFVTDRTQDGRALKLLTLVDEYTRECLAIDVRRRMRSIDVLDRLSQLFLERGTPQFIRSDNVLNASTPPVVFDSIPREAAVAAPRALGRRRRETPRGLPPMPVTSLTIVDTRSGSRSSRSSQSFKQRKAPVEGPNIIYEVDFASTARARGIDPLGSSSSRKRRYDASVLISA